MADPPGPVSPKASRAPMCAAIQADFGCRDWGGLILRRRHFVLAVLKKSEYAKK